MAAFPCLTLAAEGFELAPACLILQLVQELQTGGGSGVACIPHTCPGTLALLTRIHGRGGWERNAPAKKQVHWNSFAVWKWNAYKHSLVRSCGWRVPACLCYPASRATSSSSGGGSISCLGPQEPTAQGACGLPENTVPGRVTLSQREPGSFSSGLAGRCKTHCTVVSSEQVWDQILSPFQMSFGTHNCHGLLNESKLIKLALLTTKRTHLTIHTRALQWRYL